MVEICRDIDQGLAALNRKIDEQNKRLRDLERKQRECCDNKKPADKPAEKTDLTAILKRLTELEKVQEVLKTGTVESLNNFADIENTNQDLIQAFKGLYEMVTPLIDGVSTIVGLLGDDSE